MNIEKLVSDNYNEDAKYVNLSGKLRYLTNDEKLEVIRFIGDNYPDLQELYLGYNKITKLDNSLDKLVNLQKLGLGGNKIIRLDNSLDKLINLQKLGLGGNKIITLDNSLDKLINLQKLGLGGNKIPLVQIYNYVIFTEKLIMLFY